MIDHVTVSVSEVAASRDFYEKALAPLGYVIVMQFPQAVGFGVAGKPDFWIGAKGPGKVHVAFAASDRKAVDAFYAAAMAAGGKDNGPPGLRPHYHENFYAAYVHDLDGNNIEAVTHRPE